MKDLLIGSTTQLSYFWNDLNTEIISSRNIDLNYIKSKKWNNIYIAFAEGRTFLKDFNLFYNTNVVYTLDLINSILFNDCCNKIIYYSTSELWNTCNGPISLETEFNYDVNSPYITSKKIVTNILKGYENVIILYPFSFHSAIRKETNFLFSKVFYSIINKEKIIIGNTKYYRDILHPKFVVQQSKKIQENSIIGSGRVVFVYDLIRDLYKEFNMKLEDYIEEDQEKYEKENQKVDRNIFYLDSKECLYSYEELFLDMVIDLKKIKGE